MSPLCKLFGHKWTEHTMQWFRDLHGNPAPGTTALTCNRCGHVRDVTVTPQDLTRLHQPCSTTFAPLTDDARVIIGVNSQAYYL